LIVLSESFFVVLTLADLCFQDHSKKKKKRTNKETSGSDGAKAEQETSGKLTDFKAGKSTDDETKKKKQGRKSQQRPRTGRQEGSFSAREQKKRR